MKNRQLHHDRVILNLKDQSYPYRFPLSLFKSTKGAKDQRDQLRDTQILIDNNRTRFNALDLNAALATKADSVEISIKTNGVIGAIPIKSTVRDVAGGLIVEPRFGWSDYGSILNSIGWSASPEILKFPLVPGSAKHIPPWVIAGPLVLWIKEFLMTLTPGFTMIHEVRGIPRGKIDWNKYCTNSITRGNYHHIPCSYPDLGTNIILKSYIKWSLEIIKKSLLRSSLNDSFSSRLVELIEILLLDLTHIVSRPANKTHLANELHKNPLCSQTVINGILAINWIVDEKGLAGSNDTDGLAWRIPIAQLFERWVETVFRGWAKSIGGNLRTANSGDAIVSLIWSNSRIKSLAHLAPDIVVETSDTAYIIDAKYKGFFEELDDDRWWEISDEIRNEHRHDLHQVLAYASLYDKPRVVSLLAYPVFKSTYLRLSSIGNSISRACIPLQNKQVEVGILGLPLVTDGEITQKRVEETLLQLVNPLVT
jgi:hypothetical protein